MAPTVLPFDMEVIYTHKWHYIITCCKITNIVEFIDQNHPELDEQDSYNAQPSYL